MIDTNALPPRSSISYVSCGCSRSSHHLKGMTSSVFWTKPALSIYAINNRWRKFRSAGVEREIHVAPDLAMTLSDQFDKQELIRRGYEILSRFGIDKGQSFLCFQSQPYPGFDDDEIVRNADIIRRKNSAVVLLPIGYTHGDDSSYRVCLCDQVGR